MVTAFFLCSSTLRPRATRMLRRHPCGLVEVALVDRAADSRRAQAEHVGADHGALTSAWPSRFWTVRMSQPDSSRWLAKRCRWVWQPTGSLVQPRGRFRGCCAELGAPTCDTVSGVRAEPRSPRRETACQMRKSPAETARVSQMSRAPRHLVDRDRRVRARCCLSRAPPGARCLT
jgi:hypothetical protein